MANAVDFAQGCLASTGDDAGPPFASGLPSVQALTEDGNRTLAMVMRITRALGLRLRDTV